MTAKYHEPEARKALYAGSFNPFTTGHASIVDRALRLFDTVVIAVGVNAAKPGEADGAEDRARDIAALYAAAGDRVKVITYAGRLTADIARETGCRWLVRGARSVKDFEYERDLADINRRLAGLETVILPAVPEMSAVSSSVVRELASYGADISSFLPQPYKP